MPQVVLETVASKLIAAVTARVEIKDIGRAWEPALYQVKALLADRPELAASGRHVFLYHHPTQRDLPMDIDFGIEVSQPFGNAGAVKSMSTPAGRVATAVHIGALTTLAQTHKAIHEWCAANGHPIGGFSWETYTWGPGPDPVETVVRYSLKD